MEAQSRTIFLFQCNSAWKTVPRFPGIASADYPDADGCVRADRRKIALLGQNRLFVGFLHDPSSTSLPMA
jgi:hypothetical protein